MIKEKDMVEKNPCCPRCEGTMRAERGVALHTGLRIIQYVCFSCNRRWCPQQHPRPLTAA